MKLWVSFLLVVLNTLVLAQIPHSSEDPHAPHATEVQSDRMTISALFDSMATEAVIHRGPIGFGGAVTPRSLWLDSLTARREEWFHIDSLQSARSVTRALTIFNLDKNDEQQLFSAYAKTMGDTARITIGRGCVFTETVIADLARGQVLNAFTIGTAQEQNVNKRIMRRLDTMLLVSDNIAGRRSLQRLWKLHEFDSLAGVAHFRRIYQRTDAANALGYVLRFNSPEDTVLLIERLSRSNQNEVIETLELFDARYTENLHVVEPLMLKLAPRYGNHSTEEFYRALMKALLKISQKEGEKTLQNLEAVLNEEQRNHRSWINHVRANWRE